jgi:tRNA threonylcarbamoyladenosine biosynthesis protein TsaE
VCAAAESFLSEGPGDTEAAGARLAQRLGPGDVVLISGDLGAGKTTFVRGACRALGIDGPITSPTFTIGNRYEGGRLPVAHLDLHRLVSLGEEDPALLDDHIDERGVAFVEWPQIAEPLLLGLVTARVAMEHAGGDRRRIAIS